MSTIYADQSKTRFFLLAAPDAEQLPAGPFDIASLSGKRRQVDEQAVAAFELSEADAKKYVGEKMAAVQQLTGEIRASMEQLATDAAQVTAPEGRFMTLLAALSARFEDLQSDTPGTVGRLREHMLGMDLNELKSLAAK